MLEKARQLRRGCVQPMNRTQPLCQLGHGHVGPAFHLPPEKAADGFEPTAPLGAATLGRSDRAGSLVALPDAHSARCRNAEPSRGLMTGMTLFDERENASAKVQ